MFRKRKKANLNLHSGIVIILTIYIIPDIEDYYIRNEISQQI